MAKKEPHAVFAQKPGATAFAPGLGQSPDELQRLLTQGISHHKAGNGEAAERCYRRVLDLVPDQPDALNLLGVLAAENKYLDIAAGLLKRAADARPKDPAIQNNLGHCLFEANRAEEARDPLERAIALKPDFDEAKYNLGEVLRHLGDAEYALKLWREVWDGDKRVFAALAGICSVLAEQGLFEEAEKTALDVIKSQPDKSAGYISYAHVHKFKEDDGTLDRIENILADGQLEPNERTALRYAAGKISDDLKLYERAFHHFEAANALAHEGYNLEEVEELRRQRTMVFSPRFFRERQGWGLKTDVPVFIIGMPRSGTTLTEQILASHPDVFGAGELASFERLSHFAEEIAPTRDPAPRAYLKLTQFGAEVIGRRYMTEISRLPGRPVKRITNKLPHNFEQLGLIALSLPEAKIIHCRRNPLDTAVSCWTKNFNDAHAYNQSLTDLGRYYAGYHEIMAHWRKVLPVAILDIDYEDYIRDLEGTARKIVEFTGLEWNPACLEYYKLDRAVRTASQWQVRQPIYKSSVGRWRNYMPHIQPLIDAMGPIGEAAAKQDL